jgi:acarbose 7IV-phosphotransferase
MTILVSGLINIETTLRVDRFPIQYESVRYPFFGVNTTVSGVGYNLAKALTGLGDEVRFLSIIGRDVYQDVIQQTLRRDNISGEGVISLLDQTAQSVIIYDPSGARLINTDLKNIQDVGYPTAQFEAALQAADAAILCNINFSREYLAKARELKKLVITDVHAIYDLDDPYNRDFMANADILFMSDARLPVAPEDWAIAIMGRFPNVQIAVIGLGAAGALLAVRRDQKLDRVPAEMTRPVVNTIGAGDAMLASFTYCYLRNGGDPYRALRHAMLFASWKCGANGGADGFLTGAEFERLIAERS